MCDDPSQLGFEQKIGLFDALTQNDPKVVLVEMGEHIKTLRFIKKNRSKIIIKIILIIFLLKRFEPQEGSVYIFGVELKLLE